jgi:hypothetical protein
MDGYVPKPISRAQLFGAIDDMTDSESMAAQQA